VERFEPSPASLWPRLALVLASQHLHPLAFRALTGVLTGTARLPPERFVHPVHGLLLHRRQDVRVDVQGDGDLAVPQDLLHDLRVHLHAQEHSGRAVP
jgi:hypothetical protein